MAVMIGSESESQNCFASEGSLNRWTVPELRDLIWLPKPLLFESWRQLSLKEPDLVCALALLLVRTTHGA